MSKITKTEAPKQKKNVGYRLLALLILAACAGILFLPISTFTSGWVVEKQTLIQSVQDILASETKMFGMLPVFVNGTGILALSANFALYFLVIAIAVAAICSLIAIFSKKAAPGLVRTALFLLVGGAFLQTLSILAISNYVPELEATTDLLTIAVAAGGAVIYFLLALAKNGKAAWLTAVHFLLSLVATMLVIFGLMKADMVALRASFAATPIYKTVFIAILALLLLNLFISACRAMSVKGLSGDIVRHVAQLIVALVACFVGYAAEIQSDNYVLFCVLAAVLSAVQIIIATLQLLDRSKKRGEAATVAALADFETEEYVETYAYVGGPVAGVELAEEITPTMAAAAAAADGTKPNLATLVGNGFDAFMFNLTDKEKEEFIDLYIIRCKGSMPEIPAYVVGGDNREFFNKVFIYLGQYREKISSVLLSKMYNFSMKLS